MRRALRCASAIALLFVPLACTQVLGLDPPRRDPCAAGCFDASVDPTTNPPSGDKGDPGGKPGAPTDAGSSAPDSALQDAGTPPPRTFRCGAASRLQSCNQSTETCCAIFEDGGYTFGCMSQSVTCTGVPISCAKQSDCDPASVCCVTNSNQSCVTRGTCTGSYVCDIDASPSDCPAGFVCTHFGDPTVPYYECR